jgi:hypothetical protein
MDIVKIKSIIFKHFYLLYNRRTLYYIVKVSIISVTDLPNLTLLLSVILDYKDVFKNNA